MTQARRFAWLVMLVADAGLLAWGAMAALAPDYLLGPGSEPILAAGYEGFTGRSWQELMVTAPTAAEVERFFDASRRYFETADVGFDHPTPIPGNWKIDGIALPPDVLAKVYHHNAARLLGLP